MKSPDHSLIATDQVKGQTKFLTRGWCEVEIASINTGTHPSRFWFSTDQRDMKEGPRESLVVLGFRSWLNARQADALSTFLSGESFPFLFFMKSPK